MRRLFNHRYDQKAITQQVRLFCQFLSNSVEMMGKLVDLYDWDRGPAIFQYFLEKNWQVLVSNEIAYDYDIIGNPFYCYDAKNPELNEALYFVGAIPGQTLLDISSDTSISIDMPLILEELLAKLDVGTYGWFPPYNIVGLRDMQEDAIRLFNLADVNFNLFEFRTDKPYDWTGNTGSNRLYLENKPIRVMDEKITKIAINRWYDQAELTKHIRLFTQFLSGSLRSVDKLLELHDWNRDPDVYRHYIKNNWKVLVSLVVGGDLHVVAHPFDSFNKDYSDLEFSYFIGAAFGKTILDLDTNETVIVESPLQLVDFCTKKDGEYGYYAPFDVASFKDIQRGTVYRVKVEDAEFDLFECSSGNAHRWDKLVGQLPVECIEPDENYTDYTIDEIKQVVSEYSPLKIMEIESRFIRFKIAGSGFFFLTRSPWRIFQNDQQIASSFDSSKKLLDNLLIFKSVIGLEFPEKMTAIDPCVFLSDNMRIEYFSCDTHEPWAISLPGFPYCSAGRVLEEKRRRRNMDAPPEEFLPTNVPIDRIRRNNNKLILETDSVVYVVKNPWRLCGDDCFIDGCFEDMFQVEIIDFIDCISAYKHHKNDAISFYSKAGYLLEVICLNGQEDDTYKLLDLCKNKRTP